MPTKGNIRRITSKTLYDKIQKGCIKENYERAKKRKISQAVQRETPLRSRFPFSLSVLLRRVLVWARRSRAHLSYTSTLPGSFNKNLPCLKSFNFINN